MILLQLAYMRIGARSAAQYRIDLIGGSLGLMMHNVFAGIAAAILLNRFGNLNGWDIGSILFIFGLTRIQTGVLFAAFPALVFLDTYVREGHIDRYLTRPSGLFV